MIDRLGHEFLKPTSRKCCLSFTLQIRLARTSGRQADLVHMRLVSQRLHVDLQGTLGAFILHQVKTPSQIITFK